MQRRHQSTGAMCGSCQFCGRRATICPLDGHPKGTAICDECFLGRPMFDAPAETGSAEKGWFLDGRY
jgi:hypothetical protein